jgi:hypothetical protein
MSTEENKALVLQLMHLQEHGDLNTADQFIAPNWVNFDMLSLLQQLGVVPAPGQTS